MQKPGSRRKGDRMAYEPYASVGYYKQTYGGTIPEEELNRHLRDASRHIDSLTYNRIVGRGISDLTEFQQEIIREVVCKLADFEWENESLLKSVLSGYSINGVSMTMTAGWNIYTDRGVAMPKELYSLLQQTGLTCRVLGRC